MSNHRTEILSQLLSKIEATIPQKEVKNPSVSNATVGWQLDHALKVFNAVSEWTANSNPEDYKYKFNYWRTILLTSGYFPRGKVKAPKHVLPPETVTTEDLLKQLETARIHVGKLKSLPEKAYFKHFIFGKLSKKKTLRFLEVHTNHHLKIINDILKK
ncbi:DUF1569 domain-containing protein [Algibacter luteus]|uniref:DUF1569 domain-containing protein n=1 Tax=Algibacter luteus TaxID=1178825 RepID=UPI002597E8D6|nr:DUF1569 domain-containing protein [Algibacter luteus]WJJ97318.1 DUF1569 domain-containing protein [Algibacter luteus]